MSLGGIFLFPSFLLTFRRDEVKCREKWLNVMDPQINNQPFSPDEDSIILRETSTISTVFQDGELENSTQGDPDVYRLE
jgi:hypothetical protein